MMPAPVLSPSASQPAAASLPPTPSQFLLAWFALCPADQFVELRAIRVRDKAIRQQFFTLDATDDHFGLACSLVEDHDCYFGVCPRIRPRGRNEDVTHAPGFWADLDWKSFKDGEGGALRSLAAFPIPPTWIVSTGGGYHLYWRLKEVVRVNAGVIGRLRGIVKMLGADPAATDPSRVLRVPGTFNHKYPDCQVRIVGWPTSN